jgi:hypothetical protein
LLNGDSKPFYKYIRQKKENHSAITPNFTFNGQTASQPMEKANMLNQFFKSVFVFDDNSELPYTSTSYSIDESDVTIEEAGVLKLLNDIDTSKSCGPDKITGVLLKTFATVIVNCLTQIFKYSLSTHTLPDIWKLAYVKPIFKKGARCLPNNYRPVSLTCVCCKIFEHILSHHIHSFLERNNILVDCQHGFRAGRSCETQLVHTFNKLAVNKENGQITDVVILDFAKAFDSVNHRKLIYKLAGLGVNLQIIDWIKAFLTERKQLVIVDGCQSETCDVLSGVPQGSVLGPLLFLLYVNDLPAQIVSNCSLFADDALLYNTRDNCRILQEDLCKLESWSHNWQLSFNPSKCSVLTIGESNSQQIFFYAGVQLQIVSSHPYLGIELSFDLKWSKHIDKIEAKANRLLGMLARVLKSADTKTRMVAYNTLVRPVLEYGCQVWDPYLKKDIKKLEKIQNRGLRFIYRLKGQVSFSKIRGETGIPSLAERRKQHRIKLFYKVMESGVIENEAQLAVKQKYDTRQPSRLYVPAIKHNAYFYSFWPRTTRDIRSGDAF